jgi:hypothetical protein
MIAARSSAGAAAMVRRDLRRNQWRDDKSDALLRRVGLNPDRLRNLASLAERMSALIERRLES